jgi:hypothetical protein
MGERRRIIMPFVVFAVLAVAAVAMLLAVVWVVAGRWL